MNKTAIEKAHALLAKGNLDNITDCALSTRYRRLSIQTKSQKAMILGLTWISPEFEEEMLRNIENTKKKVLEGGDVK